MAATLSPASKSETEPSHHKALEKLHQELRKQRAEILELREDAKSRHNAYKQKKQDLAQAERDKAYLTNDNKMFEEENESLRGEVRGLKAEVEAVRSQLQESRIDQTQLKQDLKNAETEHRDHISHLELKLSEARAEHEDLSKITKRCQDDFGTFFVRIAGCLHTTMNNLGNIVDAASPLVTSGPIISTSIGGDGNGHAITATRTTSPSTARPESDMPAPDSTDVLARSASFPQKATKSSHKRKRSNANTGDYDATPLKRTAPVKFGMERKEASPTSGITIAGQSKASDLSSKEKFC